jgi:hypothetical protein
MRDLTIEFEDEDGSVYLLPAKYEVCERCEGRGQHTNPSIDGNGITMEEWWGPDWDDESREMYMNGGYDVTCVECGGLRVVPVADRDLIDAELYVRYSKHLEDKARWKAEDRHIRRMESGGLE